MRAAVERYDASLMHHLMKDGHEAGRLNDLRAIAVDHRKDRTGDAAADASDVIAEVFPGRRHRIVVARAFRNASRFCVGREIRHSSVRRIHDQRCLFAGPPCAFPPVARRSDAHPSILRHEFLLVVFSLPGERALALSEFLFG